MRFQAGQPEIPLVPARGGTLIEPEVTLSVLLDAAMGSTPGFFLQRGTNGWFAGVGGSGSGTVTQVSTSGLLTGTVTTTGTISLANGTANTLIGYGSGGAPTGITVAGAGSISGGVLTITAATPGGTTGQFQINSSGSLAGVSFSGDFTANSAGVATVTKTSGVPFAPSATIDTTNAVHITSGVMAIAQLPAFGPSGSGHSAGLVPDPGATLGTTKFFREDGTFQIPPTGSGTVGGGTTGQVGVYTGSGTTIAGANVSTLSIASTQVTGLAASATTDTTNAANIGTGTLPAARLPNPSSSTLGGTQSAAAVSHNFLTSISTSGVPTLAQPAFADISGTASTAQLPVVGLTITQHTGTIITATQSGGTLTFNWSLGDSLTGTLTANATIAFASPAVGQSVLLSIVQASSGGPFTISGWPSGITWVSALGPPLASVNAGNALLVKIYCVSSGVYFGWNLGITNEAPTAGTITEVSQTSSFTATSGAFYAISGSSAVTATLPTAVGIAGQTIRIRCVAGYTGLCTITPQGGQTIAGASSRIIFAGESPLLQSDGANWARTGGTIIPAACRLILGTNQTCAASSDILAAMSTVSFDNTGQMGDTANHQIKMLRAGQYRMTFAAYFTGATNQLYQFYINPNKNGAGTALLFQPTFPASSLGTSFAFDGNATQTFATGDLLTMHVNNTNTGSSSITLTAGETTAMEAVEILSW